MAWRGPRTTSDPSLSSKGWAKVKAHWIAQQISTCRATCCVMPGVPIDYATPFIRPASFSCGHIVPRWRAKLLGWSIDRINSIDNSRPEHRRCNLVDGARIGQRRQRAKQAKRVRIDTTTRW